MLAPKGSGSTWAPIHLEAWGTGPLPRVEAAPGNEAALKLFNQQYWTIRDLEFRGGNPHGVYISGDKGILRGIHIKNVVIHGVSGSPTTKEDGLLVIAAGSKNQRFDDVLVDGVTAYDTSQWAGILVGGVAHGYQSTNFRNTNVIVRNSIVHDVAGDGIVLFQTNNGCIENSVAWRTGMQEKETIGTPNAIWTWMCRNCMVRHNEAFLSDSPGVDGGAFDIDYGNNDNVVEENYGHDTQGYCIAIFAAGWPTENSIVRNNICAQNGLSPRLAHSQGAIYLSSWNGGKIHRLNLSGNYIFWNPPLVAAAVVNEADFEGKGLFERNTIQSASPLIIQSNSSLLFDYNSYEYSGDGKTQWQYGGKIWHGFGLYRRNSGQDIHSKLANSDRGDSTVRSLKWQLIAFVSAAEDAHDSRGEIAMLESVHSQFPGIKINIVVAEPSIPDKARANLRYDWNAGDIPLSFGDKHISRNLPALILIDPSGQTIWRHDGFTSPGQLGLLLRSKVGSPAYAEMFRHQ